MSATAAATSGIWFASVSIKTIAVIMASSSSSACGGAHSPLCGSCTNDLLRTLPNDLLRTLPNDPQRTLPGGPRLDQLGGAAQVLMCLCAAYRARPPGGTVDRHQADPW